jgi:hypothetical protein
MVSGCSYAFSGFCVVRLPLCHKKATKGEILSCMSLNGKSLLETFLSWVLIPRKTKNNNSYLAARDFDSNGLFDLF